MLDVPAEFTTFPQKNAILPTRSKRCQLYPEVTEFSLARRISPQLLIRKTKAQNEKLALNHLLGSVR